MPESSGLVQRLALTPSVTNRVAKACVQIGPTPVMTELFQVVLRSRDSASKNLLKNRMIDDLISAKLNNSEVTVEHGRHDPELLSVRIHS